MLLRGDMTKRAEKWPVIGWWWHHPVTTIGRVGQEFGSAHQQNLKNKKFKKKLKPRFFLKLFCAHKNITLYLATTFCEKTLPGNNFKKDRQDLFPYLKPPLDTLWFVHKVNTDYRPKHWKYWLGLGFVSSFYSGWVSDMVLKLNQCLVAIPP